MTITDSRPAPHRRYRRILVSRFPAAAALVAGLALGACAAQQDTHGNIPDETNLAELQVGTQTRADVQAILGTPSTIGIFDDDTWYYIGRETERVAFFESKVVDQQVVAIAFDASGYVESIRRFNQQDGRLIEMVERTTPTSGKELTVIEQLFGNLGRFNKETGQQ